MSLKMKIKKGDQVIVIAGDDKGKTGEVVKAMPSEGKVVVQGVNLVKRHTNPRRHYYQGSPDQCFQCCNR